MENNKRKTKTAGLIKAIKEKLRAKSNRGLQMEQPQRVTYCSRRLARSMAKAKMRKAGVQHVNSCIRFTNWREWAFR